MQKWSPRDSGPIIKIPQGSSEIVVMCLYLRIPLNVQRTSSSIQPVKACDAQNQEKTLSKSSSISRKLYKRVFFVVRKTKRASPRFYQLITVAGSNPGELRKWSKTSKIGIKWYTQYWQNGQVAYTVASQFSQWVRFQLPPTLFFLLKNQTCLLQLRKRIGR